MFKLLNELLKYMNKQNLSEKTISDYMNILEQFFNDYNLTPENFKLLEDPQFIKQYTNDLNSKYKPNSINAKMSAIKCFARFLITEGFISNSPLLAYKNVKVDRKQVEYFDKDDIQKLIQWFKNKAENSSYRKIDADNAKREYVQVLMLVTLGLRIDELASIRIHDVKGTNHDILAVRGKGYNGEVSRHVRIPSSVANLLQNYVTEIRSKIKIKTEEDAEYLWISSLTHKRVDKVLQRRFKDAEKDLDIGKIHAHKLRHSYATNAIMEGMPTEQICDILGHANTNTTEQIYIAKGNAVSKDNDVYKDIL